jgi:hypothetical protein
MATSNITIETQPDDLTPAYNDLFIEVDSVDKAENSFRYLFDLKINGDSAHKFKVFPKFGSLFGRLNFSKLASSYLTNTLRHIDNETLITGVDKFKSGLNLSYINIDIQCGQEYEFDKIALSGAFYGGDTSLWADYIDPAINPNLLPRTLLIFDNEPPFEAGDLVTVEQNEIIGLSGQHTVLDKFVISGGLFDGKWFIALSHIWVRNDVLTGFIFYSDKRKTTELNEIQVGTYTVFNGVRSFKDFRDWKGDDYKLTGTTKKFLTDIPRSGWNVRPNSVVLIQGYFPAAADIRFTSLLNIVLEDYSVDTTITNDVVMFDASPRVVLQDNPNITNYRISTFASARTSEFLNFNIIRKCYGFEDVEVLFMDRMGSILPFQFSLKKDKNIQVNRQSYVKDVATNEMYKYSLVDGGEEYVYIDLEERFTIRTPLMTVDEAVMLEQLVTSPYTLVRFGNGQYLKCQVITEGIQVKDKFFDGARFEDIQIKLSNPNKINW